MKLMQQENKVSKYKIGKNNRENNINKIVTDIAFSDQLIIPNDWEKTDINLFEVMAAMVLKKPIVTEINNKPLDIFFIIQTQLKYEKK